MKKIKKVVIALLIIMLFIFIPINKSVFATEGETTENSLEQSKLVTGTQSLADAIIGWLTGIGITVCGGYFIYYVYCLKTNDEGERRRNIQNIKTTLIAMILITTGLALINTILGFYK